MRNASPRSFLSSILLGAALSVTLAACASQPVNTAPSPGRAPASRGNAVGSSSSRAALDGFLTAVKAQDLQAMSVLWGSTRGAGRDLFPREELEKRLVIMQCLLQHDRWSLTEPTPRLQTGGVQAWKVTLTNKRTTSRTTLETVQGPEGRWFLSDADLATLSNNCR